MLKPADQIFAPDPRVATTSGRDGTAPITVEEQHDWVATITLGPSVPEAVLTAFDRARTAFVYARFAYELGALAEAQAIFTVELALRLRLGSRAMPGDSISNLLEKAIKDGIVAQNAAGHPLTLMMRTMRNEWAHGSDHLHTPAMSVALIGFCASLINEAFRT